jgi:hypothetical protein
MPIVDTLVVIVNKALVLNMALVTRELVMTGFLVRHGKCVVLVTILNLDLTCYQLCVEPVHLDSLVVRIGWDAMTAKRGKYPTKLEVPVKTVHRQLIQ